MLSGILKWECAILPASNIDVPTPEVAITRAINPFNLTVLKRVRYRYVFPIPPRPSMKNAPKF